MHSASLKLVDIALMIGFAYLLGSVPTGFLLGSLSGVDVRQAGSGNIGATNVARLLGKGRGFLTLAGDAGKGFVPVLLARYLDFGFGATAGVALATFIGHLYPVFLKFRGGKGVATALGVFLGLSPLAAAILLCAFALVTGASRMVSLGSIIAAGLAPVAFWLVSASPWFVALSLLVGTMVLLRHRENIRRLLAGVEPRFRL